MPNTESSIDLTQIFEPIQADLQAVEQEYAPTGATFDGLAPRGLSR